MGYYTSYELTQEGCDSKQLADLEKEVDRMNIFDCGNSDYGWCCGEAKWYDHEDDMCLLSKKFPDVLFTLQGCGESSDDRWVDYYKCGKRQGNNLRIIILPFDEEKLEAPNRYLDNYTYA